MEKISEKKAILEDYKKNSNKKLIRIVSSSFSFEFSGIPLCSYRDKEIELRIYLTDFDGFIFESKFNGSVEYKVYACMEDMKQELGYSARAIKLYNAGGIDYTEQEASLWLEKNSNKDLGI